MYNECVYLCDCYSWDLNKGGGVQITRGVMHVPKTKLIVIQSQSGEKKTGVDKVQCNKKKIMVSFNN